MEPVEYVFRIDAFTPDTLPMARLAEYLAALAKLLGYPEHTHFVRLEKGSARLVHKVDPVDAPKVETRLDGIRVGAAPKEAINARHSLDDLLANDNATGTLTEGTTGRIVIPFAGRERPKPVTFPAFREDTSIDGQVVNIGGRDSMAHATLQDGDVFHTNLSMKREQARELGKLLYGPTVRLHGNGRFERQPDGVWRMLDFRVERIERLSDQPLGEALKVVRALPGNGLMNADAYHNVAAERGQGEDDK